MSKKNGNTVEIEITWETKKLTDSEVKKGKNKLKKEAKAIVNSKLQYYHTRITVPLYPLRSERTVMVPLMNFTKDFGNSNSDNFLRLQMEQIE